MKVTIVGMGYVGLVTATCLADTGNHVMGVDIDEKKVKLLAAGKSTFYEPGLDDLLQSNVAAGRLKLTTSLAEGVEHGKVIFISAGTPPKPDGSADLSGVEAIVRGIGKLMASPKVVAIKSTVPVGTGRRMSQILESLTAHPWAMVSNPEFLREGAALDDFLYPDRVVIGSDDPEAIDLMKSLYLPFVKTAQTIMVMSREASEMVKYSANAYLAMRISFINEIADICAHTGVDINEVRAGMGADSRIGLKFLEPGVGYGGSCFPKDVQALISVAQNAHCDAGILRQVHDRNIRQKQALARMVMDRFGADLAGKTFALWGLAFKPNTDDVREAPSLDVIRMLSSAGAALRCYDPRAVEKARAELAGVKNLEFFADPYEAIRDADGLIICTEWNEFRSPDFDRIRSAMRTRVIFDGRNLHDPKTMLRHRMEYFSIGRPAAIPQHAPEAPPSKFF